MSEFNEQNWKDALISVFTRATTDPVFRALCLTNALSAIQEVSDIELPPTLKVQFYGARQDFVYAFLLPPVQTSDVNTNTNQYIAWSQLCTDPTITD